MKTKEINLKFVLLTKEEIFNLIALLKTVEAIGKLPEKKSFKKIIEALMETFKR